MVKLHITQQGSGPKILLIHGGEEAGGATAFAAQTPLAESYTLIMPDLPGHGQTPANGPVDAAHDAELVLELLTEPMHIVGSSYGGSVGMRAAIKRPEMVRSLTLAEPSTIDIAADDPEVRQMLMEMAQAIQLPDLRERLIAFANVLGIHRQFPDPLPEPYRLLSEGLPLMVRPVSDGLTTAQIAEKIVAAGIPSLVVSGGHRASWEHVCDRMASALHAERAVVTGFEHALQRNGKDFNALLEKFWASVR